MVKIRLCLWFLALSSCDITFAWVNESLSGIPIRSKRQSDDKQCVLPPYPANGQYSVGGAPDAAPGLALVAAQLQLSCRPGYQPRGLDVLLCVGGVWSGEVSPCVRACRLEPHPSVTYRCIANIEGLAGERPCRDFEPSGTVVKPQCNAPNYSHQGTLSYMRCIEGRWNYLAVCQQDCGKITPVGTPQIIEGMEARHGEFPWHAGIYLKTSTPYRLVCGGSIVSSNVIITAAHCVWSVGRVRPASDLAVVVGKLYRGWDNPNDDSEAQKFDVMSVKVPSRYQHSRTNFQDDIAALLLASTIVYKPHVKPVCLDFEPIFDRHQLRDGNIGKVAGWGLTTPDGSPAAILQVLSLPYVNVQRCIDEAPEAYRAFITSDKICAGYTNGSAICRGDSGGGLVFPELAHGVERYYLRGLVSTAPESANACNAFARTSFTHVIKHQAFIEENTILFEQSSLVYQQETTAVCVLPLYPTGGQYEVAGTGGASPGQAFYTAQLLVACDEGRFADSHPRPSCKYGQWNATLPNCIDCGQANLPGGSEHPWTAMVYNKTTSEFKCGAVVVRANIVLAKALCIVETYLYTVRDPALFKVAVGKMHPKLNDPRDSQHVQTSDVTSFHVYGEFFKGGEQYLGIGYAAWYQIVALILTTPLTFNPHVQPVCLDLNADLAKKQLEEGIGKTTSFDRNDDIPKDGPTIKEDGQLRIVEVKHTDRKTTCDTVASYLTLTLYDRLFAEICHTAIGEKGLCSFDLGFPIVYPRATRFGQRYYLRAFVLNWVLANKECAANKPFYTTAFNNYTASNLEKLGLFW